MMWAPSLALLGSLVTLCHATPCKPHQQGCSNNCARAVIASAFPERPTKADCSSYVAVTVTPATITYTSTVTDLETQTAEHIDTVTEVQLATYTDVQTATVTSTVTSIVLNKRSVSSKTIPAYASACSSPAAYTNACSCIGVTGYTVTASAPSTTITTHVTQTISETAFATTTAVVTDTDTVTATSTVTATVTEVVTSAAGSPTETVTMSLTSPSSMAGYAIWDNQDWLQWSATGSPVELVVTPEGGSLMLGSDNTMVIYATGNALYPGPLEFFSTSNSYRSSVTCSVDSDNTLACESADGRTVMAVCPGFASYVYFGTSLSSIQTQYSSVCQVASIAVAKV